MSRRSSLMLVLVFLFVPAAGPDRAADVMRFKNNLLPGHLTVHTVARLTHRTAPRKDFTEKLSYVQAGEFVQCNLEEPAGGAAGAYQMMVDRSAKVVGYFRGAESVKPLPPARQFDLPKASVRLYKQTVQSYDAPVLVPRGDAAEQAILRAALDFAHWPKDRIKAGHRWQRDISDGGFRGTQTFEFAGLERVKDQVVAGVGLRIDGAFDAPLDKEYRFGGGKIVIHWLRLERTLLGLEGKVNYKRSRPGGAEEDYELEINVTLKDLRRLDDPERDGMIDQLTVFAQADRALREGDAKAAWEMCGQFRTQWPKSVWAPAVEQLASQARPKRPPKRFKTSEIEELLAKSFIVWETARRDENFDLMDRTRRTLVELVGDYHTKLYKILRGDDNKARASVVFALALSEDAGDFLYAQKAVGDSSRYVRVAALAGLTARASPETSVETLLGALEDKKASVRARACQAVATCVPREHYSIARAVEKLAEIMIDDEEAGVRQEAIRALRAIGGPPDIARLEKALRHEVDKKNRAEIEAAIKRLEALKE